MLTITADAIIIKCRACVGRVVEGKVDMSDVSEKLSIRRTPHNKQSHG